MRLCNFDKSRFYAVAIGKFGILHRGHENLLKSLFVKSCDLGLSPAIFSFHPSPALFFSKDVTRHGRIFSFRQIFEIISSFNSNFAFFVAHFTKKFSSLSPAEFVDLLYFKMNVRAIFVGEDFKFGKEKTGDLTALLHLCEQKGMHLFTEKLLKIEESPISTTFLRTCIQRGDVAKFRSLTAFNEPFKIYGRVLKGLGLAGSVLGFKTANIRPSPSLILPEFGVYYCDVKLENETFKGVVNVGLKPTIGQFLAPLVEVHILGFEREIYEKRLEVSFLKFIRKEEKFASLEVLKAQIAKDVLFSSSIGGTLT